LFRLYVLLLSILRTDTRKCTQTHAHTFIHYQWPLWKVNVTVNAEYDSVEYKYVKLRADGSIGQWEPVQNRSVFYTHTHAKITHAHTHQQIRIMDVYAHA
jgi:hypothetical protein